MLAPADVRSARARPAKIATAQVAPSAELLGHGHEEQDQADQHKQEVGRRWPSVEAKSPPMESTE